METGRLFSHWKRQLLYERFARQGDSSGGFARIVLALIVPLGFLVSFVTAQPDFSDWSAPVNLGTFVNSPTFDASPSLSKDGRSLYFTSNRPGGFGVNDTWVSQRSSEEESWGLPINLGPVINTASGDAQPSLSRDGHWLFFVSNRPGGFGGVDIWMSYREHVHDDFDWQPAINAGPGINSSGNEADPSFFQNDDGGGPQLFFASNRPGAQGGGDIYVSNLQPDRTFGPATLVPELNSAALETGISVRFDGLEVFFSSSRSGGFGGVDLWTATRDTVFDPWSAPTNLGPLVNSVAQEDEPDIASDRETLYFRSNRPGGFGGQDLYVTTRTKEKPRQP